MGATAVRGAGRSIYVATRQAQQIKSSTARSGRGYFSLRLKLTSRPIKLHLQRPDKPYKAVGEDTEDFWYCGRNHFVKSQAFPKGRGFECNPKTCLICAHSNPASYGFADVKPDASLSQFESKPYFGVSGWIEQNYHMVEKKKDREVREGEKATFMARELCEGRNCSHCKKKIPTVFGNRFFYDFSPAVWYNVVLPVAEKISRFTKDGGYIWPTHFGCEKCGKAHLDREGRPLDMTGKCFSCKSENIGIDQDEHMAVCQDCDQKWTLLVFEDENLLGLLGEEQVCRGKKCGHKGFPTPVWQHSEGLEEWESYDIYDVQFTMKKTGSDKQSQTIIVKWELKEPDERLFDPAYQGGPNTPAEVTQGIAKRHAECLDLAKVHAADIPAVMASQLNVVNLFAGEAGRASQKSFRKFNRDEKDEDAADEEDEEAEDQDADDADEADEEDRRPARRPTRR